MNAENFPDDPARRLASLRLDPPVDRIDIDMAVRAGTRRRRARRFAVAGAFACAVLAIGSIYVVTQMGHPGGSGQIAGTSTRGAAPTPEALAGRWIAVQVDGVDVSSWRDNSGLPANIIIGADRLPDTWQINRDCGPLVQGSFTLGPDGSFRAVVPTPVAVYCPASVSLPPDLPGVLGQTAFVDVTTATGGLPRFLRLLDRHSRPLAVWREDTAITSPTPLCQRALGMGATADGTFTTVERLRSQPRSGAGDPLSEVPGGAVAVRCRINESGTAVTYAVTAAGQKARL